LGAGQWDTFFSRINHTTAAGEQGLPAAFDQQQMRQQRPE
jgi:hypothetical protein